MTEHTDHDNQQHGWTNGSTAVLDHDTQPVVAHASDDGHPAQPAQDDTPSVVTDAAREIAVKAGDLLEVNELEYLAKWLGNEEL